MYQDKRNDKNIRQNHKIYVSVYKVIPNKCPYCGGDILDYEFYIYPRKWKNPKGKKCENVTENI